MPAGERMPQYLVTSNSIVQGGVYLLDSATGEVRRVLKGSYRGLTRGPDGAFYAVTGQRNPKRDVSTIVRLTTDPWHAEPLAVHPVKDSHDLKWIGGSFYLVASVGNRILRLDAGGGLLDEFRLAPDDRDTCHVNCLVEADGALLCTVFTLTPGDRREKNHTGAWHTDGKLLRLDWDARRFTVLQEGLCQPHSLTPRPEGLYLVESHTSSITLLPPGGEGPPRRVAQHYGFLRGLAFGPGEAVLGHCIMYTRDRRRFRPLPWWLGLREKFSRFMGLWVVDERWRVRRRVHIEEAEVYDVLALSPGEVA